MLVAFLGELKVDLALLLSKEGFKLPYGFLGIGGLVSEVKNVTGVKV